MRMRTFTIGALCAVLIGCAAPPPPHLRAAAEEPLICRGAEQCQRYWGRAQAWLAQHSKWSIQTVSETVIATQTPREHSTDLGYQVFKESSGDGAWRIWIKPACANIYGCSSHYLTEVGAFKRYVRGPD